MGMYVYIYIYMYVCVYVHVRFWWMSCGVSCDVPVVVSVPARILICGGFSDTGPWGFLCHLIMLSIEMV